MKIVSLPVYLSHFRCTRVISGDKFNKNLHRKWVHFQNKVVSCVIVFELLGAFVVLIVVYILFLVQDHLDRTFVFSVRTISNLVLVRLLENNLLIWSFVFSKAKLGRPLVQPAACVPFQQLLQAAVLDLFFERV